jgi:hypothetical protein
MFKELALMHAKVVVIRSKFMLYETGEIEIRCVRIKRSVKVIVL